MCCVVLTIADWTRVGVADGKSAWDSWARRVVQNAVSSAPLDLASVWSLALRFGLHGLCEKQHNGIGALLELLADYPSSGDSCCPYEHARSTSGYRDRLQSHMWTLLSCGCHWLLLSTVAGCSKISHSAVDIEMRISKLINTKGSGAKPEMQT